MSGSEESENIERRALTPGEKFLLDSVYGDALDTNEMRIGALPFGSGGFTPGNTIFLNKRDYDDTITGLDWLGLEGRAFLVHEAAHAVQYQNGRLKESEGFVSLLVNILDGLGVKRHADAWYDFSKKLTDRVPFTEWNIEEQASYFEQLYLIVGAANEGWTINKEFLSLLLSVDTSVYGGLPLTQSGLEILATDPKCFLSGTPISMYPGSDGLPWQKPIEEIRPDDIVLSYDEDGNLQPGRVTRIFHNTAPHILDFWGTGVTPGHAYLCGDGPQRGRHVPVLDILRHDGAIVRGDGTVIRAATGCELGSVGDQMITAIVGERRPEGRTKVREVGEIRLGTRVIMEEGVDLSVLELIAANGGTVTEDGLIVTKDGGEKMPFVWTFGPSLPSPEDYVLRRSDVTLAEIEAASEMGLQPDAPGGPSIKPLTAGDTPGTTPQPTPNVPPAFAGQPDSPAKGRGKRAAKPGIGGHPRADNRRLLN